MLGITLNNSPLYLAGLLVLLFLVLILKGPSKVGLIKFRKWLKKKREERKKKKHKSIVPLVMEKKAKKVVKGKVKIVNQKVFINDWSTPLFFILGIGVLIYSLFGKVDYLAEKVISLQSFIFSFINHLFL